MIRTILAIAVVGFAAAPALAMADMSCADYTAMDAAGQAKAMTDMQEGMAAGGMMAAPDPAASEMSPEDMAMAALTACAEHPDMMIGEAMNMTKH